MTDPALRVQYGTRYAGIEEVLPHKSFGSAKYWAQQFSGIEVVSRAVTDWSLVDEDPTE